MTVRPDDLANLCALFSQLGKRAVPSEDLRRAASNALPLDADASARQIIEEARRLGLVAARRNFFHITTLGRQVGNHQGTPQIAASEAAKGILVDALYLNPDAPGANCAAFLMAFRPDADANTFVYDREPDETPETQRWLMILSRVGVIQSIGTNVLLDRKYLARVNEILANTRGCAMELQTQEWAERRDVGHVAEELAIQYEKRRFHANGFQDLIPLIRHISAIDQSAGYDVMSCRCTGRNPESPIHIEVKGTRSTQVRFIWTRNERRVAQTKRADYWIYSLTEVDVQRRVATGPHCIRDPVRRLRLPTYNVQPVDLLVERIQSDAD